MPVTLQKGQRVSLAKEAPGLKRCRVGLGWDVKQTDGGQDFDLDASILMVGSDNKLCSDKHFVFYNNLESPDGSVKHTGDNLTGEGEGDDEVLLI
ncbi:MAG: TerD family protein, partial [Synechococcaceae cyanobacterium SM2_3_1]|nr:TerD family protein [Synechococcaceae cyanobacterium SM2_3_1]